MVRAVLGVLIAASLVTLAGVDVVSFRRIRPLRRGQLPPPLPTGRTGRASPTTHLAWVAGLFIFAFGLVLPLGGPRGLPTMVAIVLLVGAGAMAAVTGWWARVTSLSADAAGFTIHYRKRRDFSMPWDECLEVRPPRTPPTGWRIVGSNGSRTLMPSDLLSNERFLGLLVDRAGLRFDGRDWRRSG